jgi:hypothetical protein
MANLATDQTPDREGRTVLATNPSSIKRRRTVTNEDNESRRDSHRRAGAVKADVMDFNYSVTI